MPFNYTVSPEPSTNIAPDCSNSFVCGISENIYAAAYNGTRKVQGLTKALNFLLKHRIIGIAALDERKSQVLHRKVV